MSRRAARLDSNHSAIVEAFTACGCKVQSLAAVGQGVPDLLVAVNGHNFLAEVKDGSLCPSDRRLTPAQKKWHAEWPGTVHVVYTVEDAVLIAGMWRKRKVA